MSEGLKPCPSFCGGKVIITGGFFPFDGGIRYYVICSKCRKNTDLCETEEDAIAAWNRRVTEEEK